MAEPLTILHADEHLAIVDKPSGLLSVETPGARGRTVQQVLAEQGLDARPVHRLDREVSGAILCARSEPARLALEDLFRERRIRKTYWALVRGTPSRTVGRLAFPILEERGRARVSARGRPAATGYRVLRSGALGSELEIDLETGRYNQIRVHLAHASHPLIGETKYAQRKGDPLRARRLALHAWRLGFEHPLADGTVEVEAPLPLELRALAERLGRGPSDRSGRA